MMTQFLLQLCAHFGSVFRQLREKLCARKLHKLCGDTRGLCAQQWFGLGDECTRLSIERHGKTSRSRHRRRRLGVEWAWTKSQNRNYGLQARVARE